jgi:hypothetical protein
LVRRWGLDLARRGPRLAREERIGILLAGCRGSMPRRAAAGRVCRAGLGCVPVVSIGWSRGENNHRGSAVGLGIGWGLGRQGALTSGWEAIGMLLAVCR